MIGRSRKYIALFTLITCFDILDCFRFSIPSIKSPPKHFDSIFSMDGNGFAIGRSFIKDLNRLTAASAAFFLVLSPWSPQYEVAHADDNTVVVIGSGGKTGKLIVPKLLEKGFHVRPTYRAIPANYEEYSNLEKPVVVDVRDEKSLQASVHDSLAVIYAASASSKGGSANEVDNIGVANTANACIKENVPKFIIISSGAVTKPDSLAYKFTNLFGKILDYKLLGENSVRRLYQSANNPAVSYTIIRPGGLGDGKAVGAIGIELNQKDTISGEVNREDVAEAVVAAVASKSLPVDVTFEIYQEDRKSVLEGKFPEKSGYERSGKLLHGNYEEMFAELVPDQKL